jgi:ubiquinone/menaquinone biosynthesis C-methylase UbiE
MKKGPIVLLSLLTLAVVGVGWYFLLPDLGEPRRLATLLELQPGMTVAEIGAGDGKIAVEMGRMVGERGHLYATELSESKRAQIASRVERAALHNVTILEAGEHTTHLPDACCEAIYMRLVYHHFTDPSGVDASMRRALKPGGRVVVVDFTPRWYLTGNPSGIANRGGHGVPEAVVESEMKAAGFTVERKVENYGHGRFAVVFR